MKKKLCLFSLFLFLGTQSVIFAAESVNDKPLSEPKKSLKNSVFVYETDEGTASGSLNRIAGQIEVDYINPIQSYDSPDHYRPGPFGREESVAESEENS